MGDEDLDLLGATGRRLDAVSFGDRLLNATLHGLEVSTVDQTDIYPVDASLLAKGHLRCRQVHDGDVAAHGPGRAFGIQQTAHAEGLDAAYCLNHDLLVDSYAFAFCECTGKEDGVRPRKEQKWIGNIGALIRELVIADVAVLKYVNTENHERRFFRTQEDALRIDHGDRIFHARYSLNAFDKALGKP